MFHNMRVTDTSSTSFQKALLAFACLSVTALLFSVNLNEYHESRALTQLRAHAQDKQEGLNGLNKHLPGRELQLSKQSKLWTPRSLPIVVDVQPKSRKGVSHFPVHPSVQHNISTIFLSYMPSSSDALWVQGYSETGSEVSVSLQANMQLPAPL